MTGTSLAGEHALITGANRGIGAFVVRDLAAAGAAITLVVRDRDGAEAVIASLPSGTRTHIAIADVTDRVALIRACADAAVALGPVTMLINNAGAVETVPFLKTTPALFEQMFAMHVMAAVTTAREVLPSMLGHKHGRIVNVSSIAGLHGAPYVAHYVVAKHGLLGLTRALAAEFAGKGVTINAVCPGYTDTELVSRSISRISKKTGLSEDRALLAILADASQPRIVHPQEVSDAIMAFLAPDAGEVNGQATVIMGQDA